MGFNRARTAMTWKRLTASAAAVVVGASVLAGCGSSTPASTPDANASGGGTYPDQGRALLRHDRDQGSAQARRLPRLHRRPVDARAGHRPGRHGRPVPEPRGHEPGHQHPVGLGEGLWGSTKPEVVMKNGDTEPNYEKIAQLRPDLIVAVYSEADQAWYDKLTQDRPDGRPHQGRERAVQREVAGQHAADRQGARQAGRGREADQGHRREAGRREEGEPGLGERDRASSRPGTRTPSRRSPRPTCAAS